MPRFFASKYKGIAAEVFATTPFSTAEMKAAFLGKDGLKDFTDLGGSVLCGVDPTSLDKVSSGDSVPPQTVFQNSISPFAPSSPTPAPPVEPESTPEFPASFNRIVFNFPSVAGHGPATRTEAKKVLVKGYLTSSKKILLCDGLIEFKIGHRES